MIRYCDIWFGKLSHTNGCMRLKIENHSQTSTPTIVEDRYKLLCETVIDEYSQVWQRVNHGC